MSDMEITGCQWLDYPSRLIDLCDRLKKAGFSVTIDIRDDMLILNIVKVKQKER